MSVDVTNTQSGGVEPEINPNDYKANITPPKEAAQPVAQETTVATPIAEEVVKPTQEEQTPPALSNEDTLPFSTPELDKDIEEPKKSLAEVEDDNLHEVELPDPIDTSHVNQFNFSAFETPVNTELEQAKPVLEDVNVEPSDNMDAFGSLDLLPDFEKEPHEIEVSVPELKTEPVKAITPTEVKPLVVTPSLKPQAKEVKTPDGAIIRSKFKNGKPEGSTNIQYPDGKDFTGYIKNGLGNGMGTMTVNGKKVTGAYKDGKMVAVLKTEPNENETPESIDVKKPFESINPKIQKSEPKLVEKLSSVTHEDTQNILASAGLNIDAERQEKITNVKKDIKDIYSILNSGKYREGKQELSNAQKDRLEKILYPLGKPSLIGVVPNAGQGKKSTKQLIREVDLRSKELHKSLDELQNQPLTESKKRQYEIISSSKKLKSQASELHPEFGKSIANTMDYVTSPEHIDFIKKELTTGDTRVSEAKLQNLKNKAYESYLKANPNMTKGYVSRNTFESLYGDKIDDLHLKVIASAREAVHVSKNKYGFEQQQRIVENTRKQMSEATSLAMHDAYQETAPYYLAKKNSIVQEIAQKHEAKKNDINAKTSETYRATLQKIVSTSPELKSIYDDYQNRINNSENQEEASKLSKELSSKLNSNPKINELNKAYRENQKQLHERNDYESNIEMIRRCGELKNGLVKDIQKTANPKIKEAFRQAGYMAQYNALGKAERLGQTKQFKSLDYDGKKTFVEQGWNNHVTEVQKFFKGNMVRTPKDENERLNKHFTEWTGELRPKTARDLEAKQQLLSKTAHDKFRTFAMYDVLSDEGQNTTQLKAMLEDRMSFVNDELAALSDQKDSRAPRHDEYIKLLEQKKNIQKGLAMDENDSNDLGDVLHGLSKSDIPFLTTLISMFENKERIGAIQRYEKGEASSADVGLLMTNNIKNTLTQLNPPSLTTTSSEILGDIFSFAAEMWATGGAGELAYTGTKAMINKVAQTAVTKVGIKNAVAKNLVAKTLTNPKDIYRIGKIAEYTLPRAAGLTARVGLMPSTQTNITEQQLEAHYSDVLLAHSGAFDDIILDIEKGHEGLLESSLKGIGRNAIAVGSELLGGPIANALINPLERSIVNYMASSQFLKRTAAGAFIRNKAFTVDNAKNIIQTVRKEGKLEGFASEYMESGIEKLGLNVLNGDPIDTGFDYKTQGETLISTGIATTFMGTLSKGYNKIVVRRSKISTNIAIGEGEDMQGASIPTPVWNEFNSKMANKDFGAPQFAVFVNNHDLDIDQVNALSNIYTKVNPQFKDNEFLNKFTQRVNEEIAGETTVKPEDIAKGDVTLIDETTPEETTPEVVQEEDKTPRELEEEQAKTENNDTENQTRLPSEVGKTKESIQAEPNQESGNQATETSGMVQSTPEQVNEIERKRQEELKNRVVYDTKPTVEDGEFKIIGDPNNKIFRINETTGRPQELNESNGLWSNTAESPNMFLEMVSRSGFQKSKDKINAKYDAEIEALKTNESTTPTNTPTDGNIQSTPEQSSEAGQGEGVQPSVESTTGKGDIEPKVEEKVTQLAKASDFDENKKQQKEKQKQELPVIDETENNPFHEIKEKGKKVLHTRVFRNKYQDNFNNIKEINDNFDNIVSQLGDEVEIRNC